MKLRTIEQRDDQQLLLRRGQIAKCINVLLLFGRFVIRINVNAHNNASDFTLNIRAQLVGRRIARQIANPYRMNHKIIIAMQPKFHCLGARSFDRLVAQT